MCPTVQLELAVDLALAGLMFESRNDPTVERDAEVGKETNDYARHVLRHDPIFQKMNRARSPAQNYKTRTQAFYRYMVGHEWADAQVYARKMTSPRPNLSAQKHNGPLGVIYKVTGYRKAYYDPYHQPGKAETYRAGGSRRVVWYPRYLVEDIINHKAKGALVRHFMNVLRGHRPAVIRHAEHPFLWKTADQTKSDLAAARSRRYKQRVNTILARSVNYQVAFLRAIETYQSLKMMNNNAPKLTVHRPLVSNSMTRGQWQEFKDKLIRRGLVGHRRSVDHLVLRSRIFECWNRPEAWEHWVRLAETVRAREARAQYLASALL